MEEDKKVKDIGDDFRRLIRKLPKISLVHLRKEFIEKGTKCAAIESMIVTLSAELLRRKWSIES